MISTNYYKQMDTTQVRLQEEYAKTKIAKILNLLDEELVGLVPVKTRIRDFTGAKPTNSSSNKFKIFAISVFAYSSCNLIGGVFIKFEY